MRDAGVFENTVTKNSAISDHEVKSEDAARRAADGAPSDVSACSMRLSG
jgi:hypothetical protein